MAATSTDFKLQVDTLKNQDDIPAKFTCEGANISPAISWTGVPEGTKSLALIVDDPDAPDPQKPEKVFTHWVLYNIPGASDHLDENMPKAAHLENGALQGPNDFGESGYGAPCPPRGQTHHYHFTLYALDAPLPLPAGASKQQVLDTLRAHILDQATLIGTYARSS